MRLIKRMLEEIMRVEILIGALLIITMVAIMVLEVVMRYVFNNSIIWVQEFVILVFIWITMLGGSAASMTKTHVTITTFSQFFSGKWKTGLQLLVSLVILGVLVYLAMNLPASIAIQNKTYTSSMPINIAKGHYYSSPLLFAVVLMLVTEVYYIYYEVRSLFGKAIPEDYVLELRGFLKKRTDGKGVSV
jgi:TRAP-type C4-dicarboxylate transport system permease small subunit